LRAAGQRLFGEIAGRYRTMKRRLAEMPMRGDRDYATLSALSQEIGRMRQKLRTDLQRRREERKRRSAASKATFLTLGGRRRQEP
jgi:alpha-D-ribose 1-methylphosphonate 5-triphosphate synthase subunit PhnG